MCDVLSDWGVNLLIYWLVLYFHCSCEKLALCAVMTSQGDIANKVTMTFNRGKIPVTVETCHTLIICTILWKSLCKSFRVDFAFKWMTFKLHLYNSFWTLKDTSTSPNFTLVSMHPSLYSCYWIISLRVHKWLVSREHLVHFVIWCIY